MAAGWFRRHPRALVALLGALLIAAGGTAVGLLNVRNLRRIDALHARGFDLARLQALRQRLEVSLLNDVREAVPAGSFLVEDVRLQVENALELKEFLTSRSAEDLRRIDALLARPEGVRRETLITALENLTREVEGPDMGHRLSLLRQEADRVVRRLNRYLAASRHAPEAPILTDLEGLVGDLLSLLRYQAPPGVELDIEMESDVRCFLPEGRVRQALLNLVSNSLHALESGGGAVTVLAEVEDGNLILEVRDDGPGFPEDLLDLVGQPFRTGRESGTGLGLAMVRRLASDLGGSLSITNLVPEGASVVLTLPCEAGNRRDPS